MAEEKEQQQQQSNTFQFNTFTKGLVTDLNNLFVSAANWIDALNIRIFSKGSAKEGTGFEVTPLPSNAVEYSLPTGYTPLGSCEFNGIKYVASINPTTGIGQIGCFPSPQNWTTTNTDFWRVYQPLHNYYVGGVDTDLNTALFKFSIEHQIDMFAREDFDGSVNLYLTDYYNPIKIVNSGFKQTGQRTGRVIIPADFTGKLNLVMQINDTPIIRDGTVIPGGSLKYGNYFVFLRYVTDTFDKTHFCASSNALQIYMGDIVSQNIETLGGGNGALTANLSNKKIVLDTVNLDVSYTYLEIGLIRYYSDPNGVQTYEVSLIDKRYLISDVVSGGNEIEILGDEGYLELTIDELVRPKMQEDINKTHTQIDNKYVGANWKEKSINYDELKEFAALIRVDWDDTLSSPADPWDPDSNINNVVGSRNGQHLHFQQTYRYTGFFRGEAYPFGVIAELNDGTITEELPICGKDDLLGTGVHDPAIVTGVLRFPDNQVSNAYRFNGATHDVHLMSVVFTMNNAALWLQTNGDWIKKNVKGIYFVRGERKKTLQYQGLMHHGFVPEAIKPSMNYDITVNSYNYGVYIETGGQDLSNALNIVGAPVNIYSQDRRARIDSTNFFWGRPINALQDVANTEITEKCIPIWRGYMPMNYVDAGGDSFNYVSRWFAKLNNYAFYTPDVFPNVDNQLNVSYIRRIAATKTVATAGFQSWRRYGDVVSDTDRIYPLFLLSDAFNYTYDKSRYCSNIRCQMIGEREFDKKSTSKNFVNYSYEGDDPDTLYYREEANNPDWFWTNRALISAKYIGIDISNDVMDDEATVTGGIYDNFGLNIVNAYSEDIYNAAIDINAWFSGNQTQYFKISQLIEPDINGGTWYDGYDTLPITSRRIFNGDCFLQRIYFKQMYWHNTLDETDGAATTDDGTDAIYYKHGHVIGLVLECKYNHAMRFDSTTGNTYYPRLDTPTFSPLPYTADNAESLLYNAGYHRTLVPLYHYQHDFDLPAKDGIYPVRVRYSEVLLPGSYIDSYRNIGIGSYRDYDITYGPINSIANLANWLISIQDDSINRHYLNEKQIQQAGITEALTLGIGEILPMFFTRLANFGTQHQWSINYRGSTIYGVDYKKKILWQVGFGDSDARGLYPVAKNLSQTLGVEKILYDFFDSRSDILVKQPDNPVFAGGMNTGFDRKFHEALFTLNDVEVIDGSVIVVATGLVAPFPTSIAYFKTNSLVDVWQFVDVGDQVAISIENDTLNSPYSNYYNVGGIYQPPLQDNFVIGTNYYTGAAAFLTYKAKLYVIKDRITLCFAESLGFFTARYSFEPKMYMNINQELFSVVHNAVTPNNHSVYLHNIANSWTNFYGVLYGWLIKFVINGNMNPVAKTYDSLVAEVPLASDLPTKDYYLFEDANYETDTQTSSHTPIVEITDSIATHRPWIDARYKENKMYMPIQAQINNAGKYTPMRGTWMTITMTYYRNKYTYLRNVLTKFRILNS